MVCGTGEAQIRLQAYLSVGGEAGALLEEDAHLVLPVDVVTGEGDEAQRIRIGLSRALLGVPGRGRTNDPGGNWHAIGQ